MKLTEYFQLTIEERIAREKAIGIQRSKKEKSKELEYTLEDYYETGDTCNFLEQLRAYQLADILGKYKLF